MNKQKPTLREEIIWFGIVLLIGGTIKREIQKQYPELKEKVPKWMWRF